ncbi:MAG: ABC transporter ATP-binding protein [Dysgonamonadaceae bacterium]|jgi:ABC-type lipoprotein export system ATPase subunit|nr:ABC transporter ATP-binding protein [Dysgonamonadaceae bacterium]
MNNYFEINNLQCSYERSADNPKIVLQVDELIVPKGEVVFIVGQSGCGKSTILETLGLMNNTVLSAGKFMIYPEKDNEIDVTKVWRQKNSVLSEIRKKYFSFIFQQTNLMSNFSIWENAVIPQLVKGGTKKYEETLKQVGLEQILNENRQKVGELSGGQQQRLAFVRAFMPNFNIIFGDEPTGNLDPENADNLMKIVADEIHAIPPTSQETRGQGSEVKTAIIVSHSPELAVKYADRIIKIHKEETLGKIDSDSVFEKRDGKWFHGKRIISNENLKKLMQ